MCASAKFSPAQKTTLILALVLLGAAASDCQGTGTVKSAPPNAPTSQEKVPEKSSDKPADKKDDKAIGSSISKVRIHVTANDKPVGNASVYVKYSEQGGLFHHDKLAEMSFKTNEDGSVKVPEVPRGKVLIQVIAKGWHTYGKWHDIETDGETIEIKLDPPPHWY